MSLGGGFVSLPDRRVQASGFHSTLARGFTGKHKAALVLLGVFCVFTLKLLSDRLYMWMENIFMPNTN